MRSLRLTGFLAVAALAGLLWTSLAPERDGAVTTETGRRGMEVSR